MTKYKLKFSMLYRVVIAAVIMVAIIFLPAYVFAEGEGTAEGDGSGNSAVKAAGVTEAGFHPDASDSGLSDDSGQTPSPTTGTDSSVDSTPPENHFETSSESVNQNSGSGDLEFESPIGVETTSPIGGNSYVPSISPDAVAVSGTGPEFLIPFGYERLVGGSPGTFTITFTEVGDKTIGSAQVEIPSGFSGINFNHDWSTANINTSSGQVWEGKLDGALIYLRAVNEAVDYLATGEWVSATFTATTPTTTGRYEFETKAWTDNAVADGGDNINNRAEGYSDPLVIVGLSVSTASELYNLNWLEHYVQTDDIDLDEAPYNQGAGWEPIDRRNGSDPYFGCFNGNSFTISNLFIDRPTQDIVGLFGYIGGVNCTILNVRLTNVNVTGRNEVGGLVGYSAGPTIHNCFVSGIVNGERYVGGLVGYSYLSRISDSHTTGVVSGNGVPENPSDVGGLVGQTYGLVGETYLGTIAGSHTSATVTGAGSNSGGLVGYNRYCPIYNSHATGAVAGTNYVGGLVGLNTDSDITNSYAMGTVTGIGECGGLIGLDYGSVISHSYSTGDVTSENNNVGGLAGYIEGSVIQKSYAAGNVIGNNDYVGGMIGYSKDSGIVDCYATGSAIGNNYYVGGLVGFVSGSTTENSYVTNSYSTGSVVGHSLAGGLIGDIFQTTVSQSFWDNITSGCITSPGGTGKTTEEMQALSTFSDAGWSIAGSNGSYPLLGWQVKGAETTWVMTGNGNGGDNGENNGGDNNDDDNNDNNGDDNGDDNSDDNGDDNDDNNNDEESGDDSSQGPDSDFGFVGLGFELPFFPAPAAGGALTNIPGQAANAVITPAFVTDGSAADLGRAIAAYNQAKQSFEANKGTMSAAERAVAEVELAIADAAIIALELSLAAQNGQAVDLSTLVAAYQAAQMVLNSNRSLLSAEQIAAAEALLNAIASVISRLSN